MTSINAYDKKTGEFAYAFPYEYTETMALSRARYLNEYWQSDMRVIKGDKLYAINEEHLHEVMHEYGQEQQSTQSVPTRLPRRVRSTQPYRKRLRSME